MRSVTQPLGLALLLGACFTPVDAGNLSPDGSRGGTGGGTGGGAATTCLTLELRQELVCATTDPGSCGGAPCGTGEVCCLATAQCVAAANREAECPATGASTSGACASNADCAASEVCVADVDLRCTGPGHCLSRTNPPYCSAPDSDRCAVCGCNGVTYASPQSAWVAGVRVGSHSACGTADTFNDIVSPARVACGVDAQCPTGDRCCALDGHCYDPAQPWRCELQPDGSIFNCASSGECQGGTGGGPGSNTGWCAGGPGCDGPGVCARVSSSANCGGDVRSVCGCDGVTYVNACWAAAAGVRVSHDGACP